MIWSWETQMYLFLLCIAFLNNWTRHVQYMTQINVHTAYSIADGVTNDPFLVCLLTLSFIKTTTTFVPKSTILKIRSCKATISLATLCLYHASETRLVFFSVLRYNGQTWFLQGELAEWKHWPESQVLSFTLWLLVGQREWRADARAHATWTSWWERGIGGMVTKLKGGKVRKSVRLTNKRWWQK